MRELDVDTQIYIPFQQFGCGSPKGTEAGKDVLVDAYGSDIALQSYSTDPLFTAFKERLDAKEWGVLPVGSAMLYDSMMLTAYAYQGCADKECAVDNIRALQDYQGVSGIISFAGKQTATRALTLTHFDGEEWSMVPG